MDAIPDLVNQAMMAEQHREKLASYAPTRRLLFFSVFQVLIPTFFVAVLWPLHSWRGTPYSFERTFAGADLLLIGATLLLGSAVEVYLLDRPSAGLEVLDRIFTLSLLLSIVFLVAYSFVRAESMTGELPQAAKLLGECAGFSLVGGTTAVLWALVNFSLLTKRLYEMKVLNQ